LGADCLDKRDDASFDSGAVSQLSVTVGASVVRQSTENCYPTMFTIRLSLPTAPPKPCTSDTKFKEDTLTTPPDRHTSMTFHIPSLQSIAKVHIVQYDTEEYVSDLMA